MSSTILIGAFVVGFLSALVGAVSTGANLISIPGMMFLGLSPIATIATTRLSAVSGGLAVVYGYHRERKVLWGYLKAFVPIAIVGGLIGPHLLGYFNQHTLEAVMGILLLATSPLLFINKQFGLKRIHTNRPKQLVGLAALLIVMIYATMFTLGGGIIMLYVLVYFFGLSITEANATGTAVWLVAAFTALIAYLSRGQVNLAYGIPLLVGAMVGGYLGARIAVHKGAAWVKLVLLVVVIVSGTRLIVEGLS